MSTRPNDSISSAKQAPIEAAIRASRDLGPIQPQTVLRVTASLVGRDAGGLDRLIASGGTVSPATFDARFAPASQAVDAALRQMDEAGLRATWTPGSDALAATGTAAKVDHLFRITIRLYRTRNGTTFYAPSGIPQLDTALRAVTNGIGGLDDYEHDRQLGSAVAVGTSCNGPPEGGYTPTQLKGAYNFGPLTRAGLSGAGTTIVFIETSTYSSDDLDCFRDAFGGAPFNIATGPLQWGSPAGNNPNEPDLDIELAHSIAPQAHLVVYYSDNNTIDIADAAQAAVIKYPTAILSVSLGGCEWEQSDQNGHPTAAPDEKVWDSALKRLAATKGTALVASGDSGAYTCGSTVTNKSTGTEVPTVSSPADDPYATAVGGTALFIGGNGTYDGEAAWADPFEASGSGGGVSLIWLAGPYQKGPGVSNSYSDGGRQVPDVSAIGDPETGIDIYQSGGWALVGGTSASTPLWAALVALVDQAAAKEGLGPIGFANNALYSFGQNLASQPAQPFHDITSGTNLYYSATPGWDDATGWGSPNSAGIEQDFLAYLRSHR